MVPGRSRMLLLGSFGLVSLVFMVSICFFLINPHLIRLPQRRPHRTHHEVEEPEQILRQQSGASLPIATSQTACLGPRGAPMSGRSEDLLHSTHQLPNTNFPSPTIGSYDALGIEKTWMTMEQRYGIYGYGEDLPDYNFTRVDWSGIDWGHLQEQCFEVNSARFAANTGDFPRIPESRFRLVGNGGPPDPPVTKTGRQAIVIRTWSTYEYHEEDLWSLRAMIQEASLATGGEFTVILLVDVKDKDGASIHTSEAAYNAILEQSVPKEFRNVAVLFHESLQHSWYPHVMEYKTFWQVMQPFQLFAHFYPEFDHYWQFEMDTRFTGDVGKMLQAFDHFGREQPYKQARERASWSYMESQHGSYHEFSSKINESMKGGASVWGPEKVRPIVPVGPAPTMDPENDDFEYGVGRGADLLLLAPLNDVRRFVDHDDWIFQDWYYGGFELGIPRYMSVPAQARASFDLLEAIHNDQAKKDLRIASEGTLPSFAMWHGLKVVGLPMPKYQFPERNLKELNVILNGGWPHEFEDGIANGLGQYHATVVNFFTRPMTFDWWSSLANPIFDRWMMLPTSEPDPNMFSGHFNYPVVPNELPTFMAEFGGKVYLPSLMIHARKSNTYRAPER